MTAARFELKMDVEEKEVVARAAALAGTTMAALLIRPLNTRTSFDII
ncbi:hypothetical protein RIE95_04000 [Acidithiobacillus thiooxidans]|nr:hypothetical protein [Acidithiobacillus thiooxidans]MDR7926166.1 hypothetical protein [Acidithiobacillus thiooxidans]